MKCALGHIYKNNHTRLEQLLLSMNKQSVLTALNSAECWTLTTSHSAMNGCEAKND